MNILRYAICAAFIAVAVATDIKGYKIKNITILPTIIVGLTIGLLSHSISDSIFGMLVPLILFPLYMLKMLGAGDIKALCAIGAVTGLEMSCKILIFTFLAGGIIALLIMLLSRNAGERFKYFFTYLKVCLLTRTPQSYQFGAGEKSFFRFAYAIGAGFICAVLNNYFHVI